MWIPWSEPQLHGREEEYVVDALRSSWISGGSYVDRLEAQIADLVGVPHAFACSNGTTALELALLALDLRPGSEIIVPGFGFFAAANAVMRMGFAPRFADIYSSSWCVDPESVRSLITNRTAAIIVIDTYGSVCSMNALEDIANLAGIPLIEDAAESFGSTLNGRAAGSFGDIGTFSFQATKTITSGEGGMLVTRRSELIQRIALLRSHGMGDTKYLHLLPGGNYRLTNVQAAIACAQLEDLPRIRAERERVGSRYRSLLHSYPGLTTQQDDSGVRQLPWAVAVKLERNYYPQGRDAVMEQLRKAGIEVRPGFYPASAHSYFSASILPIADGVAADIVVLPTYPSLSDDKIDYIVQTLVHIAQDGQP